ncbi:hypothetical protein AB0K09_02565 [Streptomyces sp. NPDC049577]|uniref:hypothetical protein n=1 Tax=Streptomyces sp. NPDC049577 TaxID=3155153 RepID=UPI00341C9162
MDHVYAPRYAVLSAHGGAGITTTVAMLDPHRQGVAVELSPGAALPPDHVPAIVTRSTPYGLSRTSALLGHWHPGLGKPWLIVIRDAPLPQLPAVSYRLRALGSRVLGTLHVPYLAALRSAEEPTATLHDRKVAKAAAALRAGLGV